MQDMFIFYFYNYNLKLFWPIDLELISYNNLWNLLILLLIVIQIIIPDS